MFSRDSVQIRGREELGGGDQQQGCRDCRVEPGKVELGEQVTRTVSCRAFPGRAEVDKEGWTNGSWIDCLEP